MTNFDLLVTSRLMIAWFRWTQLFSLPCCVIFHAKFISPWYAYPQNQRHPKACATGCAPGFLCYKTSKHLKGTNQLSKTSWKVQLSHCRPTLLCDWETMARSESGILRLEVLLPKSKAIKGWSQQSDTSCTYCVHTPMYVYITYIHLQSIYVNRAWVLMTNIIDQSSIKSEASESPTNDHPRGCFGSAWAPATSYVNSHEAAYFEENVIPGSVFIRCCRKYDCIMAANKLWYAPSWRIWRSALPLSFPHHSHLVVESHGSIDEWHRLTTIQGCTHSERCGAVLEIRPRGRAGATDIAKVEFQIR